MNHKLESMFPGIARTNINNLRYVDDATLIGQKVKRNERASLWRWQGEWKSWLKTQHSEKNKIMTTGTITSWQTERGKVEAVTDFIFLGYKITVDVDCCHETQRHLTLGRKAMTNQDSILKSRDITLLTMICIVKSIFFPVIMYKYDIWTRKKAECCRIDTF